MTLTLNEDNSATKANIQYNMHVTAVRSFVLNLFLFRMDSWYQLNKNKSVDAMMVWVPHLFWMIPTSIQRNKAPTVCTVLDIDWE